MSQHSEVTDPASLKKTLISKKRNFTRQYNSAGKITAFSQNHPTSDTAAAIKQAQDRLTKAYGEAMDILDALTDVDDNNADTYETGKEDIQDRFENMQERILASLEDINNPPTPQPTARPQAAAAGLDRRFKINDSLKPFKLNRDHNPIEFRAWCTQFRSFYTTSRLETLEIEEQQAYFRICLDPNLEARTVSYTHLTLPTILLV